MSDYLDDEPQRRYIETVDEYLAWAATLEVLEPELRYLATKQAGEYIIPTNNKLIAQAHQMLLATIRADCDEEKLMLRIKQVNHAVFQRNKPAYIFAVCATVVAVCMAVYKLSKMAFHAI